MNFFERQDEARRHSRLLMALFVLAVAGIAAGVDIVASSAWVVWRTWEGIHPPGRLATAPAGLHVAVYFSTLALIFAVSVFTSMQLRAGGGAAVARMLGGRGIGRGTEDALERRLLNVVDEMAIASGTRVPLVYVLDNQKGINAFTAGHDVSHAAIAVTRGALETLTRDELQGVVAHEFSHIVNGDMALNIRMVGLLSGIVWVGGLGQFTLRAASEADDARAWPVGIVGLLLWVIGSAGLFASRIIKAMLSRERELLADAGGVQFTRNPEGLAGALDQIRANYSWVSHPHTENISHLFFADANGWLSEQLFATHPPIEERIKRIRPGFPVEEYRTHREPGTDPRDRPPGLSPVESPVEVAWGLTAAQSAALVGVAAQADLEHAQRSVGGIPAALRQSLHEARVAADAVLALVAALGGDEGAPEAIRALAPEQHLALVDLALPALRAQPAAWRDAFVAKLRSTLSTSHVSIQAFALATLVRAQLEAPYVPAPSRYRALAQLRDDAAVLVSLVAHAGCGDVQNIDRDFVRAFQAGAVESGLVGQVSAVRRDDCTPEAAARALERLRDLRPLDKARLVKALFAAITADGVIRPVEAALMRMVGAVLDCPMPPLVTAVPAAAPQAAKVAATA